MEALDDLYKKNARDEKQEILEGRKKKLSNLLLKEKKEFEVLCLFFVLFLVFSFLRRNIILWVSRHVVNNFPVVFWLI